MGTAVIDAHQHVWQLHRFAYRWIRPDSPLYGDYLPEAARAEMEAAGVDACLLVEADNSFAETAWLLELAGSQEHVGGVVGWADLLAPEAPATLGAYAENPLFKGVRLTWLEPREDWEAVAGQLGMLVKPGLSCDLRLSPRAFSQVAAVIARNPDVTFILDHFAGADLTKVSPDLWAANLRPLAELPNVVMKVSGYLTMAPAPPLTPDDLDSFLEQALALFGAERLMFGSDWPVCTRYGASYGDALALLRAVIDPLSLDEQAAILGGTAARVYRLTPASAGASALPLPGEG